MSTHPHQRGKCFFIGRQLLSLIRKYDPTETTTKKTGSNTFQTLLVVLPSRFRKAHGTCAPGAWVPDSRKKTSEVRDHKRKNNHLGHPKPSKTLFLVPKNQVFGVENLCFSWFWVPLARTWDLRSFFSGLHPFGTGFLFKGPSVELIPRHSLGNSITAKWGSGYVQNGRLKNSPKVTSDVAFLL